MIEIKHRVSGAVLRTVDANTLSGANLSEANLYGADLSWADLYEADLREANLTGIRMNGTTGNMCEIRSMQIDKWPMAWTATDLQIGCERHSIEKWEKWDTPAGQRWIDKMDRGALDWAEVWLDVVLNIVRKSQS